VSVPPQLLNKGEQGGKNYTQAVPWMESLLFRQDGGRAVDHEVNYHEGDIYNEHEALLGS